MSLTERKKATRWFAAAVVVLVATAVPAAFAYAEESILQQVDAETLQKHVGPVNEGCMTQILYDLRHPTDKTMEGRCPAEGICDDPTERDNWYFAPGDDTLTVRIYFNIFANDDWSSPAVNYANLATAIDTLKQRYARFGITFDWDYRFINDSRFRDMNGLAEFTQAKSLYAVDPEHQCNVFVGDVHEGDSWFSYGCFPWDEVCLTWEGGIMMNAYQMPPYSYTTLAHEVGHNLGLWHTHRGVEEVLACGPCYEYPNTSDHDYTGDLCSDTWPTPITWTCGAPSTPDSCSGLPWGPGEPDNLMSYVPTECRSEVTDQQGARLRCWTTDAVSSWLSAVDIQASVTDGPAPLEVQFSGATNLTVTDWLWDFHDGEYAYQQNPSHVFQAPGLYDVEVTVETAEGVGFTRATSLIWARGDTLSFPEVSGSAGQSVRVDINACNSLPLKNLYVSFSWDGPLNLQFDSVTTTGLRTEQVADQDLIGLATDYSLAAFRFQTDGMNLIQPDNGPILSVWFTAPLGASGSNPLAISSYGSNDPRFVGYSEIIYPERIDGFFNICVPGDANGDGAGPTIDDLVYLVSYMFNDGPPPPDPKTVDVDASGGPVDIVDLIYLVGYMFNSGPPPVCGP